MPLTQSAPAEQNWLFFSRHVPLETTKPLFGFVHLQELVAASHVAPLPTGQVHKFVPAVDVDPALQAVQGVRPSGVGA